MQHFYAGAIDLIKFTNEFLQHSEYSAKYQEYNIKVENYVISTGMRKILEGTDLWKKNGSRGYGVASSLMKLILKHKKQS